MQKKKAETSGGEVVMVGARLPVGLYRQIRHLAVDQGLSVKQLLERALEEYLRESKRKQ